MARRGLKNSQLFWLTALIPLFGPLIYLCVRPPLSAAGAEIPNTYQPQTRSQEQTKLGRKIALWLLWGGFITYVLLLAPPLHLQETLTLLKNLLTGQWADINPIILSSFALVGVWL